MSRKQLTLSLISSITSKINSTDDLSELLDIIIETTREVLNSEGCSLLLYDKELDCLVFNVSKGDKKDSLTSLKVPRGKGVAGIVLNTLEPLIVNDNNDPRIYRNIDEKVGFKTKNLICVPMITQIANEEIQDGRPSMEVQGVLEAVNSIGRDEFEESDVKVLSYLSDLAAIAIRNRKLINDLKTRANELNCLFQISQELANITELDKFHENAVKSIAEVLAVARVSLVFLEQKSGVFKIINSIGFFDEENEIVNEQSKILNKVIDTGELVLVENIENSEFADIQKKHYATRSFISVPIKLNNTVIGVINVADKISKQPFDAMDARIISTISGQIGEAYNSIRLREQNTKLSLIKKDMQIASQIQKYSLPNIPKVVQSLEIETMYIACKEIGGDFYDLVYHNMEEVSLLIADVSGKGVPAALFMEFSKTILSDEVSRNSSTSISLMSADKKIQENMGYFMFVSVMLVRINMKKKTLLYSSAGHNSQYLYHASAGEVLELNGKGTPLGITNTYITEHIVEYQSGDLLFLYTDGITETMNEKDEPIGEEKIIEILKEHGKKPVDELIKIIRQTTEKFRGSADEHDDYTMMLVRLN